MFGETPTWKRRAALNVRDDIVYSLRKRKVQRIKKKKHDKVAAEKEKFKTGFGAKLMNEGASEEEASGVVEQIWTIIENAASYMFQLEPSYGNICRRTQ